MVISAVLDIHSSEIPLISLPAPGSGCCSVVRRLPCVPWASCRWWCWVRGGWGRAGGRWRSPRSRWCTTWCNPEIEHLSSHSLIVFLHLWEPELSWPDIHFGVVSTSTGGKVQAECHRLCFKEFWEVEKDGEEDTWDDVAHGPLDIADQSVVRLGDGQEPLHCDRDHDEDGAAETQPGNKSVD